MATLLITGTSGFVGGALARALAPKHTLYCLSRKVNPPIAGATMVRGEFYSFEDLRQLDKVSIDACVHLAAVTGGCREEDGIEVNVEGTRKLLRYLIDRGCRKFVNASSIAAVGFQNVKFRPQQVPLPDEHPCLDRDGYGLSKYLMEELTKYLWRQNEGIDVINIRLASIIPEDATPQPRPAGPIGPWSLGSISLMFLSDAVRCFSLAAEAPLKPGVRILNAVAAHACAACPVPELLRAWYGRDAERLDLSAFEQPGHAWDPVYDIRRIQAEIGFTPARDVPHGPG
jgi:UDP-glucose 4-epimerase